MRALPYLVLLFMVGCDRFTDFDGPIVTGVSQPVWCSDSPPAEIDIEGTGFFVRLRVDVGESGPAVNGGFSATLGGQSLLSLRWLSNELLRAETPSLTPGDHDLTVVTPEGSRASLARAVTVRGPEHSDCNTETNWWETTLRKRLRIRFNNASRSETLLDFPVLVELTPAVIDHGDVHGNGADLRFVDDDGSTELAHEIEEWHHGGTSSVWVRVPRIDAGVDTDFMWLYYDDPSAGSTEDAPGVWSGGYRAVWHLNQNPAAGTGAIRDSTTSVRHGTAANMEASDRVAAVVAGGLEFDGTDEVVRIDGSSGVGDPLDIIGGPLTISAWVLLDNTRGTIAGKRDGGGVAQWQFYTGEDNAGLFKLYHRWADSAGGKRWETTSEQPISGGWYHVAVSSNAAGEVQDFWVDGVSQPKTTGDDSGIAPVHEEVDVALGARWESDPQTDWRLDGILDEVRISAAIRSTDWMEAVVASMTGGLVTFDPPQSR